MLAALAAAVKKAPAGAASALGKFVLQALEDISYHQASKEAARLVPAGKTAEDLVRHAAFLQIAADIADAYNYDATAAELKKAFSVDVGKILDEVAPDVVAKCRECGCTEAKACPGGCSWVKKPDPKTGLGLCSSCAGPGVLVAKGKKAARKARKAKRTA